MIVYAYDDKQGLERLESVLKEIVSVDLVFRGFVNAADLLTEVRDSEGDIVFINAEYHRDSAMFLLSELYRLCPHSNLIGVAEKGSVHDALTLHRIHASDYIIKPYDMNYLYDSLRNLRFPIRDMDPQMKNISA